MSSISYVVEEATHLRFKGLVHASTMDVSNFYWSCAMLENFWNCFRLPGSYNYNTPFWVVFCAVVAHESLRHLIAEFPKDLDPQVVINVHYLDDIILMSTDLVITQALRNFLRAKGLVISTKSCRLLDWEVMKQAMPVICALLLGRTGTRWMQFHTLGASPLRVWDCYPAQRHSLVVGTLGGRPGFGPSGNQIKCSTEVVSWI